MKLKTFLISSILCLLMTNCGESIQNKTDQVFDTVTSKVFDGVNLKISHKEFSYVAPNDSLAVIHFVGTMKGHGSTDMYFAFVLGEKPDEDYWTIFMDENPVVTAEQSLDGLLAISNNGKNESDDKLLYSIIRMICGANLYSGKGKLLKDTIE